MAQTILYFLLLALILICLLSCWRGMVRLWLQLRMQRAPALTSTSQPGDYVRFCGYFCGDRKSTPVSNQPCDYWSVRIRAEFRTRKKKPQKGWQTHRPSIYKANSEKHPLMLSNGKQMVQIVVKNTFYMIRNLRRQCSKHRKVPMAELQHKVQPRYQRYLVEERWCPPLQPVVLWGYVVDGHKNCTLIGGHRRGQAPAIVFIGTPSQQTLHAIGSMAMLWLPTVLTAIMIMVVADWLQAGDLGMPMVVPAAIVMLLIAITSLMISRRFQ